MLDSPSMKGALLTAAAACAVTLTIVAPGFARSRTTNEPAIVMVKATLTDTSVRLRPDHAARGTVVTFIITNRGKKKHRFVIGDVKRGPGHGEGFARTLKPNQQLTTVMYLNYRGVLKYFNRSGKRAVARGAFRIT